MDTAILQTFRELIAPITLVPAKGEDLGLALNLATRKAYGFYRARFPSSGKELIIAVVKLPMAVDLIGRQFLTLQSQSQRPIVLAFESLKARERDRLIQRKVPFIVPGKFLFAPMLGFAGETPLFEGSWNNAVKASGLSPWAETVLIKRLLDDSLQLTSGVELAKLLNVTPMTISRALKELEDADLCSFEKRRTIKQVRFGSKDRLWRKAEKMLTSPVVATVDIAELPLALPYSGDMALEHYTMLVGLPPLTYAMSKKEFVAHKRAGRVKPGDEKLRLELWSRDPKLLMTGDYVDPISLYLSVKNSADERVRSEARKMMAELGFKVNDHE